MDMIFHFQSGRIDDQRCEILKKPNLNNGNARGLQGLLSSKKKKATGSSSSYNDKENNFVRSLDDEDLNNIDPPANKSSSHPTSTSNPLSAAASVLKATYRKASLVAYPSSSSGSSNYSSNDHNHHHHHHHHHHRSSIANPQHQNRRPTISAEHQEQLFEIIAGAQRQRMDEQRASLPIISLLNGPTGNRAINAMIPTPRKTNQQQQNVPRHVPSIYGQPQSERLLTSATGRPGCVGQEHESQSPENPIGDPEKSGSMVVPAQFRDKPTTSSSSNTVVGMSIDSLNKKPRAMTRQFQTFDHGTATSGDPKPTSDAREDSKFLDNLMKYQSTRFNDQRSEFPRKDSFQSPQARIIEKDESSQADNFFNLIVRFQSDRIEDQRSTPP